MLYKGPPLKAGIMFNGVDILDLDPHQVRNAIASLPKDQRTLVTELIKNRAGFNDVPEDYAKHAGRPSLKDVPYMQSENDGYPYLPGHVPTCDGKPYATAGGKKEVCKCKYDEWNHADGSIREVWPGMDFDDFDM